MFGTWRRDKRAAPDSGSGSGGGHGSSAAPPARAKRGKKDGGSEEERPPSYSAAPARAKAKAKRGGGGGRGGGGDTDELLCVLPQMAKLCLNSALQVRELTAAMYMTFIISSTSTIAVAMNEEAKDVIAESTKARKAAAAEEAEDGEDALAVVGKAAAAEVPLHLHVYLALLEALAKAMGPEGEADGVALVEAAKTLAAMSPDAATRMVPHCRCGRTFNSATRKLQFMVADKDHAELVARSLRRIGAEQKLGRAPPGAQERAIAQALG